MTWPNDGSCTILHHDLRCGADNKTVLDTMVEDGKHHLTRKRFNKSDDANLVRFSEDTWDALTRQRGSTASRRSSRLGSTLLPLQVAPRPGEEGVLKEVEDLQNDLEQGKKPRNRYRIDNVLMKRPSLSRPD